jgi:hypothetical protein
MRCAGVLDVALRLLGLAAVDITYDPPHVVYVVISVVALVLLKYLDDSAPWLVALRLAVVVLLAYLLGLVGLKPLLKLFTAHIDRFVELLNDLLVALGHLYS